jgi:tyrosinase
MYNSPNPGKRSVTPRAITTDGHEQIIEWSVAFSVPRYQLNGQRFFVRAFVGEVPQDPKTWATSASCAGSFVVLPPPQPPTGPVPDVQTHDEISLVQALSNVGHDGQDVNAVVEYLKTNFQWRVQLV